MPNYLSRLSSMGRLTASYKSPRIVDPLPRMRANLMTGAQAQLDQIQGRRQHGGRNWFKPIKVAAGAEPQFIACLRNGTRVLPLAESTPYLEVKSQELLLEFYKGAIAACENGELDELLLQTMPKRKAGV